MKKNLTILVILLILAGAISYFLRNSTIVLSTSPVIVDTDTVSLPETMFIKIALLGAKMETSDKKNFRGCDVVELQERVVPYSPATLDSALKKLFSKKDAWMPGELAPGNFITSQQDLFFDKVTIENGVAKIHLTGKIGPLNGVCDDPRLRIQLEETALQFNTVKSVEFYLNLEKTNLIFSQKSI